ncbi:MAG: metallophosphoesterase [Verrucomicrobiales bacterium]|nr:metallophosphoesterase [Verrucomicrobiales bacterium]
MSSIGIRLATVAAAFVAVLSACADDIALVGVGDRWKYQPAVFPVSDTWNQTEFDDHEWRDGESGFGTSTWGENTLFGDLLRGEGAIFFRKSFRVEEPAAIRSLTLRCDWQGGFVAYLNGIEIVRRNLPGFPGTPVSPETPASVRYAGWAEDIPISGFQPLLRRGTNVLAIQAHPHEVGWLDVVLVPELLANFTRGPYLQNVQQDRATVLWKTPTPQGGRVEYGPDGSLDMSVAVPSPLATQSVELSGLRPGHRYSYRVRTGPAAAEATSPVYSFQTLPSGGDLEFAVFGDSGAGSAAQFQVARQISKSRPGLVLHLGDVVYPSFVSGRADTRCLSVYRDLFRTTPFFATWGNHDLYAGPEPFLDVFRQPTNSTPLADHLAEGTRPEFYYSFDAGDAHFSVLFWPYSNQYFMREGCAQLRWLEADLAASPKPWKFLMVHHPVNTSGVHRFDDYNHNQVFDRLEVAERLLPVASRYGVQMIVSGHDHNFERFHPIRGTHTVVSGGGGIILYGLSLRDANSAVFDSRWHFTSFQLKGDMLRMAAVDAQGLVFDALEFRRTAVDSGDADGDGLSDAAELAWGTRPDDPDTDGDGLPDGWEYLRGLDLRTPDPRPPGQRFVELLAGPLPRPSAELAGFSRVGGGVELRWLHVPGFRVVIEGCDRPAGNWDVIFTGGLAGGGDANAQFLVVPADLGRRFFRVRLAPR